VGEAEDSRPLHVSFFFLKKKKERKEKLRKIKNKK